MLTMLVMGALLNVTVVILNLVIYYSLRARRTSYLLCGMPLFVISGALTAVIGLRVYQGLSSAEFAGLALSFLVLLLGAPLIPLYIRDGKA